MLAPNSGQSPTKFPDIYQLQLKLIEVIWQTLTELFRANVHIKEHEPIPLMGIMLRANDIKLTVEKAALQMFYLLVTYYSQLSLHENMKIIIKTDSKILSKIMTNYCLLIKYFLTRFT